MLVFKTYLFQLFSLLLDLYYYGLWIYIIASFVRFDRSLRWYLFLEALMAPPLRWVRKLTGGRAQIGMFDFSPILVVMLIPVLKTILQWALGI